MKKQSKTIEAINESISAAYEVVASREQMARNLETMGTAQVCDALMHSVGKAGYAYAYMSSGGISLTINMQVKKLKGNRKLASMLERIDALGVDNWKTSDYASEWSAQRTYTARIEALKLEVELIARLESDGATCEKVVIGVKTETVETVQYGIRCN